MKISELPRQMADDDRLNPLVFTGINDSPENPRLGLGYHQLYDPEVPVSLIAKLPEISRPGDEITLYWDNVKVQQYDLDQPTIEKGWLSFSVATSYIRAPSGEVYYSLLDREADSTPTCPVRTINVNRNPPGGLDPDTETAINEKLVPATITPPVINNVSTVVTVTVPAWSNMEIGDQLTVLWNNIRVEHPPLLAVGSPQRVVIPPEVLEQGGSNVRLPVSYEIRDIVDNYSLVSQTAFADVEIDQSAITAPRVEEADPITLILDLVALGGEDAHVVIPHYETIKQGDLITLTWVGRAANSEITLTLGPKPMGDPEFDPTPPFEIPNDHLQSIAGGSAMASFEVKQTTGQMLHSKRTVITLTGLPVSLAAPKVVEANASNVIDLRDLSGTTVGVSIAAYLGKQTGDTISLVWTGTPENGLPAHYTDDYTVRAGEENSAYVFDVPRINIDPLIAGTLKVKYQIIFAGTTSPVDSETSDYTVVGSAALLEKFTGQTPRLIQQGGIVDTSLLSITFISGAGNAGFPTNDSVPSDGSPSLALPMFHVCFQNPQISPGTQTLDVDLKRNCKTFQCDVYGVNLGTTISLLNSTREVIYSIKLPAQANQHFSYTDPASTIHYVRILGDEDWTIWDNFEITV